MKITKRVRFECRVNNGTAFPLLSVAVEAAFGAHGKARESPKAQV
jgi:hypothetical protein